MFDFQTWSKRRFWAVMVGVFLLGGMTVASGQEPQVAAESQTVEVVKEVPVADREAMQRLAELDQQIFDVSAEVIDAQGIGLQVAGKVLQNLDTITVAEIEEGTAIIQTQRQRMNRASDKVEQLKRERFVMLSE